MMLLDSLETDLGSFANDVANKLKGDVSSAVNSGVTNLRTDAANAATQILTGAADSVGGAIAPAGRAPVAIALTHNQLVVGIVVVVVFGLWLVFRFRRR